MDIVSNFLGSLAKHSGGVVLLEKIYEDPSYDEPKALPGDEVQILDVYVLEGFVKFDAFLIDDSGRTVASIQRERIPVSLGFEGAAEQIVGKLYRKSNR